MGHDFTGGIKLGDGRVFVGDFIECSQVFYWTLGESLWASHQVDGLLEVVPGQPDTIRAFVPQKNPERTWEHDKPKTWLITAVSCDRPDINIRLTMADRTRVFGGPWLLDGYNLQSPLVVPAHFHVKAEVVAPPGITESVIGFRSLFVSGERW